MTMKKTIILTIACMCLAVGAYAQRGSGRLSLGAGLLYKNGLDVTLAYEQDFFIHFHFHVVSYLSLCNLCFFFCFCFGTSLCRMPFLSINLFVPSGSSSASFFRSNATLWKMQ